ncbi:MAG: SpaH/EbpB family LPXTG-anchored major pilin [Ruminococcus sp.]|nr:SpaH/EbpB family LPXTG-anchored major pilin [Ruminococcus sp.]
MKTSKKIFASLLASAMLLSAIPFAANAATTNTVPDGPYTLNYTFSVDSEEKLGTYTYELFKIASLDKETAKYTVTANKSADDLQDAFKEGNSINITTEAEKLFNADKNVFGTSKATFTVNATSINTASEATVQVDNDQAGAYLVVCTSAPSQVKKVSKSLAMLPCTKPDSAEWTTVYTELTNLGAGKIDATGVDVTKEITNEDDTKNGVGLDAVGAETTYGKVSYMLTASVVGSEANKLTKFAITDVIDNALTPDDKTIKVYYNNVAEANLLADTAYTVTWGKNNCKDSKGDDVKDTFAVEMTSATLNSSEFYAAEKVIVTFDAVINANALVNTNIPNHNGLVYGNSSGVNYQDGQTVYVKTFGIDLFKVTANNTSKGLPNAEFTLYTDSAATKKFEYKADDNVTYTVTAVSGNDGIAKFVLTSSDASALYNGKDFLADPDATYYVKETKAPVGYNISSTVYTVNPSKNYAYTRVNADPKTNIGYVTNYPVTVPNTGGMGTMIFTVVGISLIACAGVLLLVVRKKNSAE